MFKHLILVSVFLSGCSSIQELDPSVYLSGKWSFTEIGKDYENNKDCDFLLPNKLVCTISETGFSNGFGDAHLYKTIGTWNVKNQMLALIETPTYNPKLQHSSQYTIKSFTTNKMVLINHYNVEQTWYKTN